MTEFDEIDQETVVSFGNEIIDTLNNGGELTRENMNAFCIEKVADFVLFKSLLLPDMNWGNVIRSMQPHFTPEDTTMYEARIPIGVLYALAVWATAERNTENHLAAWMMFGMLADQNRMAENFFMLIGKGGTFEDAKDITKQIFGDSITY